MTHEDESVQFSIRGREIELSWPKFLLFLGLGIIALLAVETLIIGLIAPALAWPIVLGLIAEVMTGREGGIAVFLDAGVPPLLTIQYSVMQDLAISFIVFPLFLFLLDRYRERDNFVMKRVRKTEETAKKHKKKIDRQGPLFLFFFMLIPFMVNGPLIGLMIGRLVRMKMKILVGVVVAATIVPAVAWTLFYNTLFSLTERFLPVDPTHITLFVIGLVVLLAIVGSIVEKVRDRRDEKKVKGEGENEEKGEGKEKNKQQERSRRRSGSRSSKAQSHES
jgi:uncharacterized membrane protein